MSSLVNQSGVSPTCRTRGIGRLRVPSVKTYRVSFSRRGHSSEVPDLLILLDCSSPSGFVSKLDLDPGRGID